MVAPTVVITAVAPATSLVAPCPVVFEATSASTMGAGTSDQCLIEWEITSDTGSAVQDQTFTDWLGQSRSLLSGVRGPTYGFVVENIASTITVQCTITNTDGESSSATVTISNTGTPTVSYALRPTGGTKWYRVGSGGNDGTPTGTGTQADPLYYRTLEAAVLAFSGTDNTVLLNRAETHNVAANPVFTGHHGTVIDATGSGALPDLTCTGGATTKVFQGAENFVIRNVQFTSNQSYGGVPTHECITVTHDNCAIIGCTFNGDTLGNAFFRHVSATDYKSGLVVINCIHNAVTGHAIPLVTNEWMLFGLTGTLSKTEHWLRILDNAGTPSRHGTMYGLSVDFSLTSSKGPYRWQAMEHVHAYYCESIGGQCDLGFDGRTHNYLRVDGCFFSSSFGNSGCLGLYNNSNDNTVVNCVFDVKDTNRWGLIKLTSTGTTNNSGLRISNNTFLMRTVSSGGVAFTPTTNEFNVTMIDIQNNLFVRLDNTWARNVIRWYTTTPVTTPDAFHDNIVPNVAGSYNIAEKNGSNQTLTNFLLEVFESGTQQEDHTISALETAGYRPAESTLARTGAATPSYVHTDVYGNDRAATSWIGAADAAPSGGGGGTASSISSLWLINIV